MLDTKFRGNLSTVSEICLLCPGIFEEFYHLWTWWPSWSCDTDSANTLSRLDTKFSFD